MAHSLESLVIRHVHRLSSPEGSAGDRAAAARQFDAALTSVGFKLSADQPVDSVAVPAGDGLATSPDGLAVIVPARKGGQSGDLVAFTPHFEHSGAVKTLAVIARPGRHGT